MKKKTLLLISYLLIFIYPAISFFQLFNAKSSSFEDFLNNYQISIWISWIALVSIAIYYKWTTKNNFFFIILYGFLIISFGLYGWYAQEIAPQINSQIGLSADYPSGIFITIKNTLAIIIFSAFLQIAVWWFTRRWHRR